jgi:hypothetical protein
MSDDQRPKAGAPAPALGVLLALMTAVVLAGLLCLFVGIGMLRLGGDWTAGSMQTAGPVTRPITGPDDGRQENSADERRDLTAGHPATRPANAPPKPQRAAAEPPAPAPAPLALAAPPAVRPASASLLGVDDHSRGGWVGQYGKRGYWVAMDGSAPHLPPGVAANQDGSHLYIWSPRTTDQRGLSVPDTPAQLSAGQWFSWDHFSLDLDLRRGSGEYQVALYLLDWDSDARVQQLEVADAESGAVLLTRTDEHFRNGRYLKLRLSGHVTLRFTKIGGANCTLSGVFLDDPPAAVR